MSLVSMWPVIVALPEHTHLVFGWHLIVITPVDGCCVITFHYLFKTSDLQDSTD